MEANAPAAQADAASPPAAANLELAAKGRTYGLGAVIAQAGYHLKLIENNLDALVAAGWSPDASAELKAGLDQLQTGAAKRADEGGQAKSATGSQEAAIDDAKAFLRKLRNALPVMLREVKPVGVTLEQFQVNGELKRKVNNIVVYLTKLQSQLQKVDEPMKRYLGGKTASLMAKELCQRLQAADASQETQLAALPASTLVVYALKGRVVQLIENANNLGKNAFDGNAAKIGQFNKDLLLRDRRKNGGGDGSESSPPSPAPA